MMKKAKEFNNILDECLERLLVKGETTEQCLASYPKQAAELEPLLLTALATKEASAIQPSPEFRARARYQFRSALSIVEPKKRRPFFSWQSRWATVVAIVLILLLAGGGTVAAASNSMPDEPLYRVKLATEQVRLALTRSEISKAELCARLADRRVAEIIYLANKGKPELVELVTQRLNNRLTMVVNLALAQMEEGGALMAPTPLPRLPEQAEDGKDVPVQLNRKARLRLLLARYAVNHPAALRAVLETAPESAKPALKRAITISVAGYEKVLKAVAEQPTGRD